MSRIVFYEKPGCAGNARQRAWLEQAGHVVDARDLLQHAWTRDGLLEFLAALPVADWFNLAAPALKSGLLDPAAIDAETALGLLLSEPLLIRRPLMRRPDGATLVGFDAARVAAWIGIDSGALPARTEGCIASGCTQTRRHDEE